MRWPRSGASSATPSGRWVTMAAAAPLAGRWRVLAAEGDSSLPVPEPRVARFERMGFGMFVHWGTYSVLGRHEWAMEMEGIPWSEYAPLAQQFKPRPNAAREWARLAKRAGMKYMVMTTKHCEGFCNFDTKFTDYCAPRQGPGRDLVKEYVEAARAEGLRVGFYYCLMDWHHPDGARCAEDEDARRRFIEYGHGQIRELCSNYGKIDILWYDVPWPLDADGWESRKMNRMVRKLQPDILINNRSGLPEDFGTPEQQERWLVPLLEGEIRRQVDAGRKGRGFLLTTASPITPPINEIKAASAR